MPDDQDVTDCAECGESIAATARFCTHCGAEQATATPAARGGHAQSGEQSGDDTDWRRIIFYTAGVFVVIGLLALGVLWLTGLGDGPEDTVQEYWGALDDADVDRANELMVGTVGDVGGDLTNETALEQTDIEVRHMETVEDDDDRATVTARVALLESDGRGVLLAVEHQLEHRDDEWIITSVAIEVIDLIV